jgi:uncharacterized protein (TIGR03435 family)
MIAALTNHLWQSTVFAAVAGLLTIGFHRNRAEVRFWLWFSASLKFIVPFWMLISLGSRPELAPVAKTIAAPAVSSTIVQIAQPFPDAFVAPRPASPAAAVDWAPRIVIGIWFAGIGVIALMRLRAWRRVREIVRASAPLAMEQISIPPHVEIRSARGLLEPGVVGWLRPVLLLPADIQERLTPRQLDAVLAHELCHIRRRDNLTSAVHMIVEAILWFYPVTWWIGARLIAERERACDEEVVRLGNEPLVYAEGILHVCSSYLESPLRCVSGVTGSDLKKRIQAILAGRVARNMNITRKVVLAAAGMWALAVPIVVGMVHGAPFQTTVSPITRSADTPKWEAVSIKACDPGTSERPGARGGVGSSPGRLNVQCMPLMFLLEVAYVRMAEPQFKPQWNVPISGGPNWIRSDPYTIEAKAEGLPSRQVMEGPMFQALIEDRFKLKIHRETKEVPVYDLVVAKGGSKLPDVKSCEPFDVYKAEESVRNGGGLNIQPNACGIERLGRNGGGLRWSLDGVTVSDFALYLRLDRRVIDKTGIAGLHNFKLEFGVDHVSMPFLPSQAWQDRTGGTMPIDDPGGGPSILTAIQEQLGLKLDPTKGPGEFIVIDSVERPGEN